MIKSHTVTIKITDHQLTMIKNALYVYKAAQKKLVESDDRRYEEKIMDDLLKQLPDYLPWE